ncbi:MAG: radical SAM protein [Deltaproteobacteria bacterium]|nr:radical SAM protein [Deltaproteobacteria bacterium]
MSGSRSKTIREVGQLGELMPVPEAQRAALGQVLGRFEVRVTRHLEPLIAQSEAVARQFLPDVREVEGLGEARCFSGLLATGVPGVERMYLDRCIVMPHPVCPAYCRYCFRKFYQHGAGSAMSEEQLDQALAFIAGDPRLREVLITGGEPVMDKRRLSHLLSGLRRIPQIGPIRVACRSLVLAPELIDDQLIALLSAHQDLRAGKPLEIACHINHPDEISAPTVERIVALRHAGLSLYNQTVLLRGINCDASILLALFRRLRSYGVESYYLFFAGPVAGMDHQRPRIDEALAIKAELRRQATGRLNPRFIVTTRIGKVELGVDGRIVEREADGRHLWIKTPYALAELQAVDPAFRLPDDCYLADDGAIVVRYLDGPLPAAKP